MKVHIDKAMGRPISEARIGRIMKRLNLCAIVRRKNPYRQRVKQWQEELPQNILNREFDADAPGEKFVTDVTYIPYVEGSQWKWAYLSVVLDLYDRSVVAWVLSKRQDARLARATLRLVEGKYRCHNAIFHSDRGSIYTSQEFQNNLERLSLRHSLSRSGNCWDNAPMESFNGSLKTEWLYNPYCCDKQLPSYCDPERAIDKYMSHYNERRLHSSNAYLAPFEKRASYFASVQPLQA